MKTMKGSILFALIITGSYSHVLASIGDKTPKGKSIKIKEEESFSKVKYSDLIKKGISMDSLENYSSAISIFTKAIEINKDLPEAYDKRGISSSKLQHYSRAIKDFDKAISLAPQTSIFYNHRAIIYYCLEIYDLAIQDYNYAIKLEPNSGKTYFNRGLLKIKIDDTDGAIKDLKEALRLNYGAAQVILADMLND